MQAEKNHVPPNFAFVKHYLVALMITSLDLKTVLAESCISLVCM